MKALSLHKHVSLTSSLHQIDSSSGCFAFFQKGLNSWLTSNTMDMIKPVFFQTLSNASLVVSTDYAYLVNNSNSSNINHNVNNIDMCTMNFPMMDNSVVSTTTFTINNVLHFNSFIVPSYF